jgi:predicted PurR-regulated permease PerM
VSERELIKRTATVLVMVGFGWLLLQFLIAIVDILVLLLVSVVLAAGFAPLVRIIERWRLPGGNRLSRGVAIFVLYVALFALIGGILSIIIVPAAGEAAGFVKSLPEFLGRVRVWLVDIHQRVRWLPDLTPTLDRLPAQVAGLSRYGPQAAEAAFRFIGGIASVVAVLVFTFYMMLEGAQMKSVFLSLLPADERPRASRILREIGVKFGGWLRAQVLLSFTVAAIVTAGLAILRIPYPFLLGIVAGLGELIPMVGPSLGAAVAILVALSQTYSQLIGVVIFYVIIMNVEPHFIVPRIMSRVVGMSPLLTLFALLVGIKLLGILGGLLAVPVAAALQVIGEEIAQEIQPDAPPPQPDAEIAIGPRKAKRR